MLDREHLLISLGPPDAGLVREGSSAAQSYCLLVWSIPQVPLPLSSASDYHMGCCILQQKQPSGAVGRVPSRVREDRRAAPPVSFTLPIGQFA